MQSALQLALAVSLAAALGAQVPLDADTRPGQIAIRNFDTYYADRQAAQLACRVERYAPALDYGLRLWTGFNASLPAQQFKLQGNENVAVIFRVRPLARPAAVRYFWLGTALPVLSAAERAPKRLELSLGGGLVAGPGRYQVDWMLIDGSGRRCRESWTFEAATGGVAVPTAADSVEPAWADAWPGFSPCADGGQHVTIFLHAAPVRPRRNVARLSPWDRHVLWSTVVSLLRNTQFCSASLVMFDLERSKVLWREASLTRDGLYRMRRQLAAVDLATVSYATLHHGPTPKTFLETMLREELRQQAGQGTVVFIGTTWRAGPKLRAIAADVKESLPKAYFVAYTYPGAVLDDSLSSLVRSAKGRILPVMKPKDLASAERAIAAGQ